MHDVLQAHLLRINMGNIYFEQHKYPAAIKMYRMALDQVPLTSRSVRSKILRNIGVAFMQVGQYQVLPPPPLPPNKPPPLPGTVRKSSACVALRFASRGSGCNLLVM